MQTTAKLRYARISPQKCRLVVDTIRGKSATLAVNHLEVHAEEGRASIVRKVLIRRSPTPTTISTPTWMI